MPVCVECGSAISNLYREFSGNIKTLAVCHRCGQFADRYIENDKVIKFIDMMLHKPGVYRHLLFNFTEYRDQGFDPNMLKVAFLWILFDVYIRFLHFEKGHDLELDGEHPENFLFIPKLLLLCLLETVVYHLGIMQAVRSFYIKNKYAIIKYNYISNALIISSFGKLIIVLMVIWDYNDMAYTWWINVFVLSSNAEALSVFLETQYWQSLFFVLIGQAFRLLFQLIVHFMVDPTVPIWWLL